MYPYGTVSNHYEDLKYLFILNSKCVIIITIRSVDCKSNNRGLLLDHDQLTNTKETS
jgi:hypothetical protein